MSNLHRHGSLKNETNDLIVRILFVRDVSDKLRVRIYSLPGLMTSGSVLPVTYGLWPQTIISNHYSFISRVRPTARLDPTIGRVRCVNFLRRSTCLLSNLRPSYEVSVVTPLSGFDSGRGYLLVAPSLKYRTLPISV